jgi:AT family autotransporter
LQKIEKDLRSIAKRYKSVKYSIGLAILFLMMGLNAFSADVSTELDTANYTGVVTREGIKDSVDNLQDKIKGVRLENTKSIEALRLELIQLMEQGNQVVKSPWASWQFGIGYLFTDLHGRERGTGDKSERYRFESYYTRYDWKTINASDGEDSERPQGSPLLVGKPGGLGSSSSILGKTVNKNGAISSSVNGRNRYGLVDLRYVKEKPTDVEIFAKVNPKKIEKDPLDVDPPKFELKDPKGLTVNPYIAKPEEAPTIKLPNIGQIEIEALNITAPNAPSAPSTPTISVSITPPTAPNISVTPGAPSAPEAPNVSVSVVAPAINVLNIETPATVSVSAPTVDAPEPVAFSVAPTINAADNRLGSTPRKIDNNQTGVDNFFPTNQPRSYDVDTVNKDVRNFFTFGKVNGNVTLPNTGTINVKIDDTRAIVLDEPQNASKFKMEGTINLYGTKNMGIDLQGSANDQSGFNGTGTSYKSDKVAYAEVKNAGKIIGSYYKNEAGTSTPTNKNQIAFGFSNLDSSFNNTMTHIINSGTISLNAPESAGIQLKPEDPHNWKPDWNNMTTVNGKDVVNIQGGGTGTANKGRVLMKADNQNEIDVNSRGSFGIITVFNPGISELTAITSSTNPNKFNDKALSNLKAQRNLGGVDILPGGEIGRSALDNTDYISGVYNSGSINITGDKSVGVGILQEIQEVKVGGTINIGTTAITQGENQDLGGTPQTKGLVENAVGIYAAVPTMPVLIGDRDTLGNMATTKDVGTKTVEFGPFGDTGVSTGAKPGSGTINIGANATKSIGLLVSDNFEELNNGSLDEEDENGHTTTGSNAARKLKRSGSITAKAGAKVEVRGTSNYGFVVSSDSYKSEFPSLDNLKITRDKTNYGIGINEGTITLTDATDSIGFALLKGGNSKNAIVTNNIGGTTTTTAIGKIEVIGNSKKSTGFYGEQDNFTNEGDITVNTPGSSLNAGENIAVLLNGNTKPIDFKNTGNISVSGKSNIGVYATGKSKFLHDKYTRPGAAASNKLKVENGSTGVYVKGLSATGSNITIKAPVEIGNSSSTTGTTIGFLSDAGTYDIINFEDVTGTNNLFDLKIGKKSVGLYSTKTSEFNNVFKFNLTNTPNAASVANVTLDEDATFSFFNDATATGIGNVLVNKKLKFNMAKGSTLGYIKNGATVSIDQNLDTTDNTKFATATISTVGTSLLLATGTNSGNASTAKIDSGKIVKTTTNVGLISTDGAKAINEGSLTSDIVSGVGLYSKKATAENSSTTSTITMNKEKSAAIFGEDNSTLTNKGTINLEDKESGGILAKDSNVTNSGSASKIYVKEESSVGIDATLTGSTLSPAVTLTGDKVAKNEGLIELQTNAKTSAAIIGKRETGSTKKLTIENVGTATNSATLDIKSKESVGINATNIAGTAGNLIVNNEYGKINIEGKESVGINALESTVTNDTNGIIELKNEKTAGIIATKSSKVTNKGNITLTGPTVGITASGNGLVGVSLAGSELTNEGSITMNTAYSTGVYANDYVNGSTRTKSKVTNEKDILVKKEKSVGIYSVNGDVYNKATNGKIETEEDSSVGIYAKLDKDAIANQTIENAKNITIGKSTAESSVGIYATIDSVGTKSLNITNDTTGIIDVDSKKSAAIIMKGQLDNAVTPAPRGIVTNKGKINMNSEKSAAIIGERAKIVNDGTTPAEIIVNDKESAGIIASDKSIVQNFGKIKTSATITSTTEVLVAISVDDTEVTNKGQIELDSKFSTAIFGANKSKILNDTDGTIVANKEASVGIYAKTNSPATNKGSITMKEKSSAAMYGDESKLVNTTTTGKLTIEKESSAAMYAKNADALNDTEAKITVKDKTSAGMYFELNKANLAINGTNKGEITLTNTANKSVGMFAKNASPADKVMNLTNEGIIDVNATSTTDSSVAMMAENTLATDKLVLDNKKNINLSGEKAIGMLLINATGNNTGSSANINVTNKNATGVFAKAGSKFKNISGAKITIDTSTNNNNQAVGVFADGIGTVAENSSTIEGISKNAVAMFSQDKANVTNKNSITMNKEKSVAMFAKDEDSKAINEANIKILGDNSVGMFGKVKATVQNTGTIDLGTTGSNLTGLIGMFGQSSNASEPVKIENLGGIINVNTKSSAAMYADNSSGTVSNVTLENTGTINVKKEKSAGIYAPKSTVSKVGKVNLADVADGASAVYIEDGGVVTAAETAEINLGTANQNRVAYYVKNAGSNVKGTSIGKITGYGVGVYLQGTAAAPGVTASQATLDSNTATLDYTTGATGNGIIGLYLAGNTDISAYNKAIKVGDTVGNNYAIGVYTDGQGTLGTPGSPYSITQNITAGKNGVGIFADKSSNLEYNGTMKVGEVGGTGSSSSGVGIYIANQGGTGSKVTLGSTGNIELYGKGGVGAIVTKDSNFTATTGSKIELKEGSGVGVFGLKGSTIDAEHLTFINNGYQAEKIRSIGGKAHIIADETIAQGIVLTHVINGETSLASGKTITAQGKNIGLMAEGIKDPATTGWQNGDYEIINKGTLDFSNAPESTALYSLSSRLKNEGAIKVGNKSTGIYGEYRLDTPKYDEDVNPSPTPNKSSIETTASSSITLTNSESSAIYVKNLKNVDNKGSITAATGKTKNLGIYAINDGTANDATGNQNLDLKNSGAISLGDASVAIYSKGESNTLRNKVDNTGDLTVGKQTSEGSAIAIYAENTDVKTNSTATVGENGLVFYGKNSDIEAKGSANFSNKGILAYLEDSKFTSYLGNLTGADNTILFIKNSQVNLAGNGTPVDVSVAANQTGMQIEGTSSTLEGIKNITLGQNSTAIYLKNGNLTFTADKISSTSNNAKGILAINSDLTNNSKIDLSGDSSVGIYADAPASKTIKNTGDMTLAGKETLGVYLAGTQKYENYGNINIADSADAKHPTIGTYVKGNADVYHKAGDINVGSKSVGIYSKANSLVSVEAGNLNVKDQGTGIYKEKGTVSLAGTLNVAPHTATTKNSEPVGLYARDGVTVTDNLTSTTIGEKSYGIILNSSSTPNVYTNTSSGTVELGNDSTYLYSEGNANITNNRNIAPTANADRSIAFYIKGNGEANTKFVNNGNIDLSVGKGTMGIYAPNAEAVNKANITVGKIDDTDPVTQQVYPKDKITYSIGMATADKGKIYNEGNIILTGNKSLGMYGDGEGTVIENRAGGKIILKPGATATATDKITNMTGVLVNNGATFINKGDITTDINYSYNPNVSGLIGVAVLNGSKLENHGNITIDADNSYGIVIRGKKNADGTIKYAVIKNYGNIKVRGTGTTGVSWENVSADDIAALKNQIGAALSADPIKNAIYTAEGTDKALEGVDIKIVNGQPIVTRNGVVVPSEIVNKIVGANNVGMSDIGFYVDTLGATKPIDIDMNGASLPPINSQLIIGTEYSKMTNSKQWFVTDGVIQPFLNMVAGQNFKLSSFAGSLTWLATPVLDGSQNIVGVSMAKIPYTSFVERTDNAYNFTDGLEQRYDKNALDSKEKEVFTKINSIGKNEGTLLTQTFDEMMGHQYANVQRRILSTNDFFKRELSSLFD